MGPEKVALSDHVAIRIFEALNLDIKNVVQAQLVLVSGKPAKLVVERVLLNTDVEKIARVIGEYQVVSKDG